MSTAEATQRPRRGRPPKPADRPCTKCGRGEPDVSFGYNSRGYRQSACRCCENAAHLRRYYARKAAQLAALASTPH